MLLVCGIIAIPVMAIVALVRTGKLRESLDERFSEQTDRIRDLDAQVSSLRRELKQLELSVSIHNVVPTPVAVADPPRPSPKEEIRPREVANPAQPQEASQASAARIVTAQSQPAFVAGFQSSTPAETLSSPTKTETSKAIPSMSAAAVNPQIPGTADPSSVRTSTSATPGHPVSQQAAAPIFRSVVSELRREQLPPRKSIAERLRSTLPLEEILGLNLFAKIGIILLVLGFALLGRVALISMGPAERVCLIYAVSGALLGGGIWLERKERYRLVGRTGIGGGWALLFFTTYGMHHVAPMAILQSNTADCFLMLIVAIAMVLHTLRYKSQLVTGLAFLLAFSTLVLSQDSVYSLVAGVILALGIIAIALRMGWFELEIFGIVASFANHFYWLYRLYPHGAAGHPFPQFWASAIILILYWLVFRISYVVRRIRSPRDEMLSTVAALLNPVLLLATMKFQSTRPELAFYALLGLGAFEFFFGQLPITRRRRPAFVLLSVLGTILIFASVPFKFSGNNIALLWMIVAEVLLIAGITQKEFVFRRLGLIGGLSTGLLVVYEASSIISLRQTSQSPLIKDGVLLLACSVLFYINAYFIRVRWMSFFTGIEETLAIGQSYLGALTAFLGTWAIFTNDWTAVAWVLLMLAFAWGKWRLDDNHLLVQTFSFAVAVLAAVCTLNIHINHVYPNHAIGRIITLPILACAFYLEYWILREGQDWCVFVRRVALWLGSAMLVTLAWTDVKQTWVALIWIALAAVLGLVGRKLELDDLNYQEHLLAVMGAAQLAAININASTISERYIPLIACAAIFYAISRFCTVGGAAYSRPAAWAHTCAATALLAALAWHESSQPWLAAIWVVFALALALTDRFFSVEEFPWQAHVLAILAVIRAVTLNLYIKDKWHSVDLRLITVSILVAGLYALARWIRLPDSLQSTEARHGYTWVASGLFAWMLWSELQPVSIALGFAIFGLILFEIGHWRGIRQLRLQGYAGLIAGFVRIFFVNLTAASAHGERISPRIYTVVPIAIIYFFVWAQLQARSDSRESTRVPLVDLIAYLGTASVVALVYFQVPAEWIVLAWAILVVLLMTASLLFNKELFLHQGELLTIGIVARGLAHNIYGGSYFTREGWRGSIGVLSLTLGILLLSLPIAFRLRSRYAEEISTNRLIRTLALRWPEQFLFFAPVLLMSFMIAVKLNPGMVTLAWGIEGVMVIVLGLIASQRSYRLTGLLLLLLCVGKIVIRDAWHLAERDRYITFIALGAALTLVSTLYGKYRETVRKLL